MYPDQTYRPGVVECTVKDRIQPVRLAFTSNFKNIAGGVCMCVCVCVCACAAVHMHHFLFTQKCSLVVLGRYQAQQLQSVNPT